MTVAGQYSLVDLENELAEFVALAVGRNFRHFSVSPLNFQTIARVLQVLFVAPTAINVIAVEGLQCRSFCSGMIACIMFDTKGELK